MADEPPHEEKEYLVHHQLDVETGYLLIRTAGYAF